MNIRGFLTISFTNYAIHFAGAERFPRKSPKTQMRLRQTDIMNEEMSAEERDILDRFQRGELRSVSNAEQEIEAARQAARNTFNTSSPELKCPNNS